MTIHLKMPCIETKRLYVRPVEEADASDLHSIYADERVVMGNSVIKPFLSVDETLHFLHSVPLAYQQRKQPQGMVLEQKDTGIVIGSMDIETIFKDTGEIGYMLAYAYWNQGYMEEALEALIYIGFNDCGYHRIQAEYDPVNKASGRVLEKLGFVKEGMRRQAMMLNDDRYHDLIMCSLLKEEYKPPLEHFLHIERNDEKEDAI